MSRWESGARERLQRAAFELFAERGYSAISVPEIAERAGLTNRTFYRYFGDKREVLFAAEADFPARISEAITGAPHPGTLMDVLAHGLEKAASRFPNAQRDDLRTRRAIVLSDADLRERELGKQAALASAMRTGFMSLGFADFESALAAEIASAVFTVALNRWLDQDSPQSFQEVVRMTVEMVGVLTAPGPPATPVDVAGIRDDSFMRSTQRSAHVLGGVNDA